MKTLAQYLQEARKNPELNPKVSVNQEIIDHLNSAKKLSGTAVKNSFVSFTKVDKLGINPGSTYDTPIGIYCYPAEYVKEKTNETLSMSRLPFAGSSPYANIFSVRGNIVDLNNLSNKDLDKYYEKIANFYVEYKGYKKGTEDWQTTIYSLKSIFTDARDKAKFKSNGGQFWYATMKLAEILTSDTKWRTSNPAVSWNKLFRKLDIDGCVDMGEGIIHTSEPTQAVFFSKDVIVKNKRVDNKYSPESVGMAIKRGKRLKDNVWEGGTWTGEEDWRIGTWKTGIWKDGIWADGIWKKGMWKKGMWQKGIWKNGTWEYGSWHDGTWHDGTWHDGTWFSGDWKNGTWKNGTWLSGSWFNGTWKDGTWKSGIWNKGTWEGGTWIFGIWKNGTWENGTWKNGTWERGKWLGGFDKNGNFHPEDDSPDKW